MASGHNDPKLLYAIQGVSAYHLAYGKEEPLTPGGPQTLSLLMVPTSSSFADPSSFDARQDAPPEDFYLHLHLPPELDIPLPATTQIYHQPPTSYLVPRWDLGPDSGAFTRLEFPSVGSRKGLQEDVDTFETILAQCTAFLERAPPPRTAKVEKEKGTDKSPSISPSAAPSSARVSKTGSKSKAQTSSSPSSRSEKLPAYNPAEYKPGEGYVQGSHSSAHGGQIVLIDEEDGSVIGELTDGFQVVESGVKPGSKDPVEITLPTEGNKLAVVPASTESIEELHPAYKKSFLVSKAAYASRLIITTSDLVSNAMASGSDNFVKNTKSANNPLTFQTTTHERVRRIGKFSGSVAEVSSKTVGQVTKVAQNLGAHLAGRGQKDKTGSRGYGPDGQPLDTFKPGLLNKSLMAFSTVADGIEQASRSLLTSASSSATTVVTHRWGAEAGELSKHLGSSVKSVGLVYIDVTGVSRRAVIKAVGKGMVVGKVNIGNNQTADVITDILIPSNMLHEILLSLSGHPSPLLRNAHSDETASLLLSPPERQLLSTAANLSDLHCKLRTETSHISREHPSVICRAVSAAIVSCYLAEFQRKILEVEESILRKDTALVGAYNIVPLTAVVGEFSGWTRRLEWLHSLVEFINKDTDDGSPCQAAQLLNRLREGLQTGFADISETAHNLLQVAEISWLKQTAAWILYGRIPLVGQYDFFICQDEQSEQSNQGYRIVQSLLPSFVTPSTAASILFVGVSINRTSRGSTGLAAHRLSRLASQHQELAQLPSPINTVVFSRAISSIRSTLSRTVLSTLLPLEKVVEILVVLRQFFLVGRGEFAMALIQQADERIRGRWRRADKLVYEKRSGAGLGDVIVKEGELATVLARTWTSLGAIRGQHADEDDALELGRELLRLDIPTATRNSASEKVFDRTSAALLDAIAPTPFRNLLFSVPVTLTLPILSPLDLFLTQSDLEIYTSIHSYLLSIRRAHIRLTDLWKITSLRRHHPPPPRAPHGNTKGGIAKTKLLRERWSLRSSITRSSWSTCSAALFFLAETESYLQVEVVEGLSSNFHEWLTGHPDFVRKGSVDDQLNETEKNARPNHDPQTLSTAHRLYLSALTKRILLTQSAYTTPLYDLLIHIDHLVSYIQRLHGIWVSLDLEADEGVVDAFSNLDAEEREVRAQLRAVERNVKHGIEEAIASLRTLSLDSNFAADMELDEEIDDVDPGEDGGEARYRPRRVGGIDRLLMKLDFGQWFGPTTD
ncbi:Spc98 family-domain-containing protein [Xylariaceae sp. FL1019]|nr:Spc98 family-domain-containing protein [Xylariaceae sp. FL1019]